MRITLQVGQRWHRLWTDCQTYDESIVEIVEINSDRSVTCKTIQVIDSTKSDSGSYEEGQEWQSTTLPSQAPWRGSSRTRPDGRG